MVLWVHDVVNDDPSGDSVTSVACTGVLEPVPPAPAEHATTHSIVPASVTFEAASTLPTVSPASSVPLNGEVTLATTGEMARAILPSVSSSYSTADPWKPDGHAVNVDHVGVEDSGPLAGLNVSQPRLLPKKGTPAA
jgi:hypothetical protein